MLLRENRRGDHRRHRCLQHADHQSQPLHSGRTTHEIGEERRQRDLPCETQADRAQLGAFEPQAELQADGEERQR
jgi:hypothetical protein